MKPKSLRSLSIHLFVSGGICGELTDMHNIVQIRVNIIDSISFCKCRLLYLNVFGY
jgi:hypothetical protein